MLVAYVPLLLTYIEESEERGFAKRTWYAFFSLVGFHALTNWWIASWQEQTDPYLFSTGLMLLIVHPLSLLPGFIALSSIRKRLGVTWTLLSFPFVLTSFEWMHGQTDFSYPWLTSGYALIHTPMAQVADAVGVYGLSFLVATVNALVVYVFSSRSATTKELAKGLVAILAFIAIWAVIGEVQNVAYTQTVATDNTQGVSVLLVQPNENPWDKWTDSRQQLAVHLSITDSAIYAVAKPDLVVWSETALPFVIQDARHDVEWSALKSWVARSNVSLLTGVADRLIYAPGMAPPSARSSSVDPNIRYDVFNAAYVLNPDTVAPQVHRKSMLTPFAERLPFADQLTFAMSWIEWGVGISAWGKGTARVPLHVVRNGDTLIKLGTIICIESIYPEAARDQVQNGANALCVITNDAWYNGTAGPRQHYDIARMRAIETRRPILRCANSGITGLIGPTGKSIAELPAEQSGATLVTIYPETETTIYVRYGNVLAYISVVAVLFLLLVARIPSLQRILSIRSTIS